MRRVVLLLALAVAVHLPAWGADDNPFRLLPGARGENCLECHGTFEDTLKLSSVHTPVQGGECIGCHDPHASSHGMLLSAAPDEICANCHEDIAPADAKSAHDSVVSGECVSCHDPHASNHANNLLEEGNELCAGCHSEIAEAAVSVKFSHHPVRQNCSTCHDPHASESSPSLLREDDPALCVECHDPTRASFSEQHMGYPVEQGRCSSCHDPHGSSQPGMLRASVHRPVVTKMCGQCHEDASSPRALEVKSVGLDLCRGCHSTMVNETMLRDRVHAPILDRASCQSCHSPHASDVAGLLPSEPLILCATCHQDTIARQERSIVAHPPVSEGECSACHSPHSSNNEHLLAADDTIELCGSCHDWKAHSSHPIGSTAVDSRNPNLTIDCLSCHYSHGSEFRHLATFDPGSDLCVSCHETFGR